MDMYPRGSIGKNIIKRNGNVIKDCHVMLCSSENSIPVYLIVDTEQNAEKLLKVVDECVFAVRLGEQNIFQR